MKFKNLNRAIVATAMMLIGILPTMATNYGLTYAIDGICYQICRNNWGADYVKVVRASSSYETEYVGDIVIPDKVEIKNDNGRIVEYTVKEIGNSAFYECTKLSSIQLPGTITKIGEYAFYKCTGLKKLEFPNSVAIIEDYALGHCYYIKYLSFGDGIKEIPGISGCTYLETLCLGKNVESFKDPWIQNENLENIVWNIVWFPDLVDPSDPGHLFYDVRENIKTITFGESVEYVPDNLCYGMINLEEITFGSNITSMGKNATYYCSPKHINWNADKIDSYTLPTSVKTITFSNSLTKISKNLLKDTKVSSVTIPESVKLIDEAAFTRCLNLTSIKIPDSVDSIAPYLCCDCNNLKNVKLSDRLKSIPAQAFYNCSSLEDIILPESLTTIDSQAFYNCSSLGNITFPETLTTIDSQAFYNCEKIWKIEIPESVTTMGAGVFTNCKSLITIVWNSIKCSNFSSFESSPFYELGGEVVDFIFGNKVEYIPTYIFTSAMADITSIEIPYSVKSIGAYAFYNCGSINTIYCYPINAPGLMMSKWSDTVKSVFDNDVYNSAKLYISQYASNYDDTDKLNYWQYFKNIAILPKLAKSITLDKTEEVIQKVNDTICLSVSISPQKGTDKSVVWTSSDENIVTVNENGVVTAIAVGEATITATTKDGSNLSAICKITVLQKVESITLDKTEITLKATETTTLVATVLPELATDKSVVWSSSDENVATVDVNGVITAVAVGEATITATTVDGSNLSAICKVIVSPALAESVILDKTEISLKATETATIIATVLPEQTTSNKSVTWTSSDESIATVDANGVVTAIAVGEAIITATTVDGSNLSATCKINVIPTLATSIELDKTEYSAEEKSEIQLVATVLPEFTTNKSVTWASSDESIAIVNANGIVTAIAIGEATITATTTDGSNLSATCKVTVLPILAMSIELDKTECSVEEKSEIQLTATILPENTTNKEVAWSSSNSTIASIDDKGLVKVNTIGEAIITATTTDGTNLSATCHISVYTGVDGVNGENVIVMTIGDNILVKDAPLGSNVNVYSADGALVKSVTVTDGNVVVEVPTKGVYIVMVDGESFKVMVK